MAKVVVILSDGELEDVRERAGLVPLSAWFRALAFPNKLVTGEAKGERAEIVRGAISADHKRTVNLVSNNHGDSTPKASVRPHNFHSGTRPVAGCGECRKLVKRG